MKNEKLTYGKLEQVLRHLHFDRLDNSPYRLYVNKDHDSVITLPNMADESVVDPVHLSGVTTNLVYKGIVEDTFAFQQYLEGRNGAAPRRRPRPKVKKTTVSLPVLKETNQS